MFELAFERILANVTNAIRHSVVYPAALDQNVTSGSVYLRQHIENSLVKCPEQKYLLYGYSQGASLVLDSLGKLCPKAAEAIASVTLIGNPFRVPHRLSNVNREGHYDNRISFGRFANQAHKNNASIPMLSDTLDRSGRALDICLDVSFDINSMHYSWITTNRSRMIRFVHLIRIVRAQLTRITCLTAWLRRCRI